MPLSPSSSSRTSAARADGALASHLKVELAGEMQSKVGHVAPLARANGDPEVTQGRRRVAAHIERDEVGESEAGVIALVCMAVSAARSWLSRAPLASPPSLLCLRRRPARLAAQRALPFAAQCALPASRPSVPCLPRALPASRPACVTPSLPRRAACPASLLTHDACSPSDVRPHLLVELSEEV